MSRLVRRWIPLLLFGPLLGGLAGYLVVQRIPSVYQATVTLMVQPGDTLGNAVQDLQAAQDLTATYAEAIHTRRILADAASQVGLDGLPERELESRVQARRVTGTQLLRVSVDDTSPARAAQFANAVAQVFVKSNADAQASRYASSRDNLSQLIAQLQKDIDSRVAAINDLSAQPASPERDAQVLQFENNLAQIRATYGNTVRTYEDLRVTEARGANTATVFDPAVEPPDAVRPNRSLTAFLAALAGLVVASLIVLVAEYFDDRLDDGSRVVATTGLATLGVLPNDHAPRNLREANGRGSLASYRVLRSRLSAVMRQTGVRSVLVTSAEAGEGKSTVVANLALALAEAGQRVILVDADIHSPAQMRLFELPNYHGLSTLLLADPDSTIPALNETWVPNLQVLTAGPLPLDPSGLLSSSRLPALIDEIVTLCDVLLIDAPALLSEPDSLLLSSHVDAVLFVIDARHTRGRVAARAVQSLRNSGAYVLGAIMNRAGKDAVEFLPYESSALASSGLDGVAPGHRTEVGAGRSVATAYDSVKGK